MSSRYCVYSLWVPNRTLLNYFDPESVKESLLLTNSLTEIYFIFDFERKVSLQFCFTDSATALTRCNDENKSHGSTIFEYIDYDTATNKTILIDNVSYEFSSNAEQKDDLILKVASKPEGINYIVDELKNYALKKYSNDNDKSKKYEI